MHKSNPPCGVRILEPLVYSRMLYQQSVVVSSVRLKLSVLHLAAARDNLGVRLTNRRLARPLPPGCTCRCCKALIGGEETETHVWSLVWGLKIGRNCGCSKLLDTTLTTLSPGKHKNRAIMRPPASKL